MSTVEERADLQAPLLEPVTLADELVIDAAPPRNRMRQLIVFGLPPVLVFLAFIGFWYVVSYVFLDARRRNILVPPPHDVVQESFLKWDNFQPLLEALGRSAQVALVGLLVAVLIGVVVAVAMSQARWIERSLFPYAVMLQAVPILALVPLLGFWWGYNFRTRVVVCVLISLFPIVSNTLFGLLSADRGQHDLFTLHKAGRLTRLFRLQFPAAMPAIFAGLRISAGLSVIGAIVGDFFFRQGEAGIGILIDIYRARLRVEELYGAIILSSLLGVVVFWVFGVLANRVVGSWYESTRKST